MTPATPEQFAALLAQPESINLEFKRASKFETKRLAEYCAGMYNARGGAGRILLGVDDQQSHQVVGTGVFRDLGEIERLLHQLLGLTIRVEEYFHAGKRVLIVHVPEPRNGKLLGMGGKFFIRRGDALMKMTEEEIVDRLATDGRHDFSARLSEATFTDLEPDLVARYISECTGKVPNGLARTPNPAQFLRNIKLLVGDQATFAALILFGSEDAVWQLLPASEICHIYKPDKHADSKTWSRRDFRGGVWRHLDDLWELINTYKTDQHYQHRFAMEAVPTFDEISIREAIINAVSHRDYTTSGSSYVLQTPTAVEIVNPGGFIKGLT